MDHGEPGLADPGTSLHVTPLPVKLPPGARFWTHRCPEGWRGATIYTSAGLRCSVCKRIVQEEDCIDGGPAVVLTPDDRL